MIIETSPVLVLDSFTDLRSKPYTFSFNNPNGARSASGIIQRAKQEGIQKAPKCEDYKKSLFMSETTKATIYSIRSNLDLLTVKNKTN